MLYYPDLSLPSESELAAKGLRFWPSGPRGYRGYARAVEAEHARGTVIVFHGNAGTAADRDYYSSALGALGYRVILAEYPGYGGREGELSEPSFVNDGLETLRLAAKAHPGPVYLLGESLGCGVVAGVAREASPDIAGIVLITPWNTLLAVAKDHHPLLPVGWFMKDRYDNAENLKSYPGRIAVVGAERDEVVPVKHARDLFALLPGEKRMWVIPGAGHNDWVLRMHPSLWRQIMDFLPVPSPGAS
ncbi:MAG: alpha/beta hydrolase [Deltaproteobacteria bacterium]|nr:alpha/beta hydrolase [Deltaproteobacteria bacterium]